MAKHERLGLYDPRLDPERKVLGYKHALLDEQMGTDRIRRAGEEYIATCHCGGRVVTSQWPVVAHFEREHRHG